MTYISVEKHTGPVGSILSLLLSMSSVIAANGLLYTVVALRVTAGDTSLSFSGLVIAAYATGLMAGALKCSWFIERVGHIRSYAAFCALSTIFTLMMGVFEAKAMWFLLRAGSGFCLGGGFLVIESWLSEQTPSERRGVILALYVTVCQLALAGGQALLHFVDLSTNQPFVLAGALYALGLVPIALTLTPQPAPPEPKRRSLLRIIRLAPVAVLGALISGITLGSLLGLGPAYAETTGLSKDQISILMAACIAGGIVLQWPVGLISDRIDRRIVIEFVALATLIASLFMLNTNAGSMYLGTLTWAAFGAFAFVIYPLSLAHGQDLARPEDVVATSGTIVFCYGAGAAIGPAAGAVVMDLGGPSAFPIWLGSSNGLLVIIAIIRQLVRRRLPIVDPVEFAPVALPQVAPASDMDPRGD
ncbi:MAG: MFS transporter [Planctomycetes bacterium]|nr:MFS transporter [Planctomycetota bacterium]